jgi:hypothetical protein
MSSRSRKRMLRSFGSDIRSQYYLWAYHYQQQIFKELQQQIKAVSSTGAYKTDRADCKRGRSLEPNNDTFSVLKQSGIQNMRENREVGFEC